MERAPVRRRAAVLPRVRRGAVAGSRHWGPHGGGMIGRLAIGIATAVVAFAAPAGSGSVSGTFAVKGGGTIAPKHAAAFETRDSRNPRQMAVEVVLSAVPVDLVRAMKSLAPHTDVINQDALMKHDYVLLWVRRDGNVSMN